MNDPVFEGDIGTEFFVTIVDQDDAVVNLTGVSAKKIVLYNTDTKERLEKTGVEVVEEDLTNGLLKYVGVADDFKITTPTVPGGKGTWQIQGFVTLGAGSWTSTKDSFECRKQL